ncbi:SusD/RagB family nutrient-binding outer membrane lipoprotein [Sunxiuqinia rutila]|uniref:SusD/RagB family nutrient-binding outer membrane lipoprotein n=1 Tax=Sunxiuqinia rutila TaxID=1397841 RepID=UPI003D3620AF
MNLNKIIIGFAALILFAACSKFDELNTNSDSATKVNSKLLATGAIMGIMKPSSGAGFVDSQFLPKYLAWGEGSRGNQYNNFGRASFDSFTTLRNYRLMAELAEERDRNAYEALALFLESYLIYNQTIAVGDIPYSEILKGKENLLTPKYDAQKDIFKSLLTNLDRSVELFGNASDFEGDPIFGGNVNKWRKVVNAFELRVLINLSKKESDPDLNVKQKFAQVYQRGLLMEGNGDNLQLVFSSKSGQLYPFNIAYNKHFDYPMLSNTLMDILQENNDYRMFYFASPSKAKLAEGKVESDFDAYVGVEVSDPIEDIRAKYVSGEYCGFNKRFIYYEPGEPYILIGYAEQNFILAEAALRGWITEDASLFYTKGIRAHFDFLREWTPDDVTYHHGRKITDEVIDDYLVNPSVQLSGEFEDKLEMLMEQKYVASFLQLAWQSYYDYRRTGYPVLPINPETNLNFKEPSKIPVRWLYPQVEFDYNKEQVQKALDSQYEGVDEVNKLMWILK